MLDDENIEQEQHDHAHMLARELTKNLLAYVGGNGNVTPAAALLATEMLVVAMRSFLVDNMEVPPAMLIPASLQGAQCSKESYKLLCEAEALLMTYQIELEDERLELQNRINTPGGDA